MRKFLVCIGLLFLVACTDAPRSRPVPPDQDFYPNLAEVPPRASPMTEPEERDTLLDNLEEMQQQAQITRLNALK